MKLAIIGTGISGLTCAHLLHREHDVTLYEANDYIGGHTHTVDAEVAGETHSIDTGFVVFNDWTYPNFIGLLDELGVSSQPTSMGFSVRCEVSGIEYSGRNLSTLFAQKRNLFKGSHYRMLLDILRFNHQGLNQWESLPDEMTVGEFLSRHHFSSAFADRYLLPMGAAIWSCPMLTFREFPIGFIIAFYKNHGLLNISNRPVWRVVQGGSRSYVDKLIRPFQDRIRLNSPVSRVMREGPGVRVISNGKAEGFDEVIFACHSDQSLLMLNDSTDTEREILSEFPYGKNTAVLHTDVQLLPQRRSTWSSWNYRVRSEEFRPSVTYNMNILQQIDAAETFCVTLNDEDRVDPSRKLGTFQYSHPIFTNRRAQVQSRHAELIRQNRTSYCGAYWGNGFHEDGVTSALRVCSAFGMLPKWSSEEVRTRDFVVTDGGAS
ncbi:protoporphyrinogen oxidase [Thalassoglobus neptunius]|uniref:Protoporphyrinogen oxidase n=1 Tax=Thalassoglobus neptunius TaxID=1938619 RepID=A0A5C5WAF7_9PLAN|nr:FAD-dependent oxidoreductase [Thalassoglobus neptunius]TWT47145.1 protoporphyrinogen oxidase [Thalassoglobus neptunius]